MSHPAPNGNGKRHASPQSLHAAVKSIGDILRHWERHWPHPSPPSGPSAADDF